MKDGTFHEILEDFLVTISLFFFPFSFLLLLPLWIRYVLGHVTLSHGLLWPVQFSLNFYFSSSAWIISTGLFSSSMTLSSADSNPMF